MTTHEASKILKMLLGYLKGEIEPPNPKKIEEAVKFEQDGYECLNLAIRSLECWEKVKEEIQEKINDLDERTIYTEMENGKWYGLTLAKTILDKHLKEVENEKRK